ncbi:biopolymer transporter ExbD [uncultured Tenacibaculum sp.]|uniref:biopolymer transporter ExbD n=1 Tax=uncultured Tenacibaculum sp. TaxID=174713 RepID=UPI002601A4FD|nr:biopolymer transporter ExbD [uncultured Tenacibaculum sp.]
MKKTIIILLTLGFAITSSQAQTIKNKNNTLNNVDNRGIPKRLTKIKKEKKKHDLSNAIKVHIDSENQIFVNNKKVSIDELKKDIRNYESKCKSKSVIIFTSSKATSFGFYIEVENAMLREIKYLRELLANRKFKTNLDNLSDKQLLEIKEVYPQEIIDRQ